MINIVILQINVGTNKSTAVKANRTTLLNIMLYKKSLREWFFKDEITRMYTIYLKDRCSILDNIIPM